MMPKDMVRVDMNQIRLAIMNCEDSMNTIRPMDGDHEDLFTRLNDEVNRIIQGDVIYEL